MYLECSSLELSFVDSMDVRGSLNSAMYLNLDAMGAYEMSLWFLLLAFFHLAVASVIPSPRPLVLWHGLGRSRWA